MVTLLLESLRINAAFSSAGIVEEVQGERDLNVVHLPTDLRSVARLNPALHDAIVRASAYSSQGPERPLHAHLAAVLAERGLPCKDTLSPGTIGRLRVADLRASLDAVGGDTAGTKDVLTQRLVHMLQQESGGLAQTPPEAMPSAPLASTPAGRFGVAAKVPHRPRPSTAHLPAFRPDPLALAAALAAAHASNVVVLDVAGRCAVADAMVVATGRSPAQLRGQAEAVVDWLERGARGAGCAPPGCRVEGGHGAEWLLVDGGRVIVHLMLEGARRAYDLEALWGEEGRSVHSVEAAPGVQTLDGLMPGAGA
ncbi:hypothetical protein ACKKBG_A13095 [Auxenochlorella protothecoides x Auxenochlorella symbiontica]